MLAILFHLISFAMASGVGGIAGATAVSPSLTTPAITAPSSRQVFQRNNSNVGSIAITGTYTGSYTAIQASVSPINGNGTFVDWTQIVGAGSSSPFSGTLSAPPGWYTLRLRVINGAAFSAAASLAKVGVGEVFICAGQSLMSNGGNARNFTNDDRVSAVDRSGVWQLADDPQPGVADGLTGGSPIPVIGNLLVAHLNMPVAFLDVAYGGTSTAVWISTDYAAYLKPAMDYFGVNGFRAILWEQGQTDGGLGVSAAQYEANMATLINQSRSDEGWNVPWGIATVSTVSSNAPFTTIQTAQLFVRSNNTFTFAGSNSDSIPNSDRYDGTHFNTAGQIIQGGYWDTSIESYIHSLGL